MDRFICFLTTTSDDVLDFGSNTCMVAGVARVDMIRKNNSKKNIMSFSDAV
jgi:hypothetical protein